MLPSLELALFQSPSLPQPDLVACRYRPCVPCECQVDKSVSRLGEAVVDIRARSEAPIVFNPEADVAEALTYTGSLFDEMETLQTRAATLKQFQRNFKIEVTKFTAMEEVHAEVRLKKTLWKSVHEWESMTVSWKEAAFMDIDAEEMSQQVNAKFKQVYTLNKSLPANDVLPKLQRNVEHMKAKLPLIQDLRNPNLKPRHWEQVNEVVGHELVHDDTFTLGLLDEICAFDHAEKLQEIGGNASSEAALETMLSKLETAWKDIELPCVSFRESKDVFILGAMDEIQVLLDDSQVLYMGEGLCSKDLFPIDFHCHKGLCSQDRFAVEFHCNKDVCSKDLVALDLNKGALSI